MKHKSKNLEALISEQLSDSDALLLAFRDLFSDISSGATAAAIVTSVLKLRRSRAIFERSRARLSQIANFEVNQSELAHALSRKYATVVETERIYQDWVSSLSVKNIDSVFHLLISRLPGLFDPEIDILVCFGERSDETVNDIRNLGFMRVYSENRISELTNNGSKSDDNERLDGFIAKIKDIEITPPRICTAIEFNTDHATNVSENRKNALLGAVRNSLMRVLSTRSTLNKSSELWAINAIKNRVDWRDYKDLNSLVGAFNGATAYIVGPAPSLDDNIEELKKAAKAGVVICVSQALRKLREHGIIPHFVIITDAMYMPDDFRCGLEGVWGYVFDVVTDPRHRPKNDTNLFPYISSDLKRYAYQEVWGSEVPKLESFGSVSHSAIYLAKLLGAKQIALVGHDFCFSNGQQYSRLKSGQVTTYQIDESRKSRFNVKTYSGYEAQTKLDYDMFRVSVGKIAEVFRRDGIKIYNTSPRAATVHDVGMRRILEISSQSEKIDIEKSLSRVTPIGLYAPDLVVDQSELECVKKLVRNGISKFSDNSGKSADDEAILAALRAIKDISKKVPGLSMMLQEKLSKVDERLAITSSQESKKAILIDFLTSFDVGLVNYQNNIFA